MATEDNAPSDSRASAIAAAEERFADIATRYFTGNYLQRDGTALFASALACIEYLDGLRTGKPFAGPLLVTNIAIDNAHSVVEVKSHTPVEAESKFYEEPWEPAAQ